jgi:hemolysin activation/secretion protein
MAQHVYSRSINSMSSQTAALLSVSKLSIVNAAFAICTCLVVAVPAAAQQANTTPTSAANTSFAIRGFSIKGANPLSSNETSMVLAPFLRADANIDVLQKATAALEEALRVAGFALHRVALPAQEVGDTVTLEIVKFTLGKVTVQGNERYDTANVLASLPELKEGSTPNFGRLAIQTAIANENPSKQIGVTLKESEQPDAIDAAVQVKETKPWNISLSLSNTGSKSSGRDRVTMSGGYNNLWNADHQFVAAYTTSLQRPQDVKQLGLSYRAPMYEWGGVVGVAVTQSDVVGNFGTFTSTGRGRTMGINYSHYLSPEGGRRSFVTIALDDKLFRATEINGFQIGEDRRSRPLTLGYAVRNESNASASGYSAELAVNTGSGSNNNLAAYQAEDTRITTRAFKIARAGANYTAQLESKWLWSLRTQLQYSPKALISGEQFGLGGVSSLRGATDRVLIGDSGLASSLEITSPAIAQGLRISAFIDAGWLKSVDADGLTKIGHDKLASVGLGLRYAAPFGALVSADYGYIVSGSNLPLTGNSSAPPKGSDKLHVNLSMRF